MSRIVIDARIIETSTGLYMQRLVYFLHKMQDEENEYIILIPEQHVAKWQSKLPRFSVQAANQKWYTFAEQWSFYWQLKSLHPDLVHFTMPQQPLLWTQPAITTIHDTTLLRFDNIDDMHPIEYKMRKAIFQSLVRVVVWRAARILVPTAFVRNDLIKFVHGKHEEKFIITLEAGEPVDDEPEMIQYLVDKKFFFFVGNAFPYKNLTRTILAYREFKKDHPEYHLVFAGKKEFFYEQLETFIKEEKIPDVHILGFISDGEKRWAFQHASAFVTASLSEGFHIPILEALYEDCPVISSNASCLPEVAGDAALYFDPHSTDDLVTKMKLLESDEGLRNELIAKGRVQVKKFSWEKMTKETHDSYRVVLGS